MRKIFSTAKNATKVLLIVGLVSACTSELDQPVNGNLSTDEFYKTPEDANNALVGVYDGYGNTYNAIWPSMYLVRDIISDDVNAGGSDQNDQAGFQQMDDFKHDSQNDQVQGAWNNLWSALYRANKVITTTTPDNAAMKQVIAEAKVLRAFIYMDLVSMWGGVPIILDEIPYTEYQTQVRATRAEVLAQIQKDATEAIADLPVKSALSAGNKFRVSKGTAQALAGKAYLYDEKWALAVASFNDVISSNEYALESQINAVFNRNNEFGKESLFELNYINFNGNDWGNYAWGNATEDNIIVQLMGPRGDFYTPATGDSLIGGWGFNTPTAELYNQYVAAGDVNRRRKVIMSETELEAAGGNWTSPTAWDYEGFFRRKYGSFSNQSGGPVQELNYATNFVLLRYADVLLMAAEANYRNGSEPQALIYLNQVRQRPGTGLPPVVAAGPALFDAIVLERRLELAFEGHRFPDLVRWGLADDELANLGFVAGKHEVLPIPNADVLSGKIAQNPNY